MRICQSAVLAFIFVAALSAQPLARQFSVNIGAGGAIPREDLESFMTTSPFLRVGFGYRPYRYLQADVGMDAIFRAAGVRDFQDTIIGRIKIRDNEILVPFGGRGILPIGPRLELFGGGGAAYLHYGESVQVPGGGDDSSFKCRTCRSRGGWGAYATAGLNVAVEREPSLLGGCGEPPVSRQDQRGSSGRRASARNPRYLDQHRRVLHGPLPLKLWGRIFILHAGL